MIRHLTTLVLCGVLGSMVLVGNAEACHKKKCGRAPTVCAAPAPMPAPCVTYCRPRARPRSSIAASSCRRSATRRPPARTVASAPAPVATATAAHELRGTDHLRCARSYPTATPRPRCSTEASHFDADLA